MFTRTTSPEFDLVLQGATGFTGRLAAKEIAQRAPSGFRWAVAGRSADRVGQLAAKFGVPGVVADGLNRSAVDQLARRTRVVISCAGPFARYGDHLVDACAQNGTHYADLTGELPWIQRVIERHHKSCAGTNTALVPCAGFDSVPTDIAVHAMAQELGEPARIHGFFTIKGGLNGGTLHSGLALGEDGELVGGKTQTREDPPVFPIPSLGRWAAPFLMAPVNEWVAARTDSLLDRESQGYQVNYSEHLSERSRFRAHTMASLLKLSNGLLAHRAGRQILRALGPKPGEGPSESSIQNGFARLVLLAGDLLAPKLTRQWIWSGDPSNLITVRCLVQTGLALAAGEASRGGVLTPVAALGDRLGERLLEIGAVTVS